ncbi:MAG: ATP synthase F1 subunit gamma [Acidimicrobiales bacterium]|jgi:F-type H+-transporting ATPase subunit gamma
MAGGQERILRRRIRTIQSTKKITRSFELIAASQITRAQGRIAGSRPYLAAISDIVAETAREGANPTRLLGIPLSPENVLVLVVVADRGLAGAYNSNVLRATERLLRSGSQAGQSYRVMAVGKKAQTYFRFRHRPVDRQFVGMSDRPTYEDARRVAAVVVQPFLDGEVDLVQIVSTRIRSTSRQVVETRQLLPIPPRPGPVGERAAGSSPDGQGTGPGAAGAVGGTGTPAPERKLGFFEFEPDVEALLARLVPLYAEAAVYAALLEAAASEHASRQRAMSAATENAEELLKTLTRVMNRARQDSITTEIMEIVGGSEALRSAGGVPEELTHPKATEEQSP